MASLSGNAKPASVGTLRTRRQNTVGLSSDMVYLIRPPLMSRADQASQSKWHALACSFGPLTIGEYELVALFLGGIRCAGASWGTKTETR